MDVRRLKGHAMNTPRFRSTLPGAATLWAFSLALVLLAGAAFAGEPAASPVEPSPAAVSLDKVEDYFREAKEDFLKKDLPEAAAAIRKAESAIRGHIPKAAREARKVLELSADDLKELALRVEKGLARSAEDLASAFARACSSMMPPRAVLMIRAVGFIVRSCSSPMRLRVPSVNVVCTVTKSDSLKS